MIPLTTTLVGEETRARAIIARLGPAAAYSTLLAENNAAIRGPLLDNGRAIVSARTALHTEIVRVWAEEQAAAFGYSEPFAVFALGGTGRGECCPASDFDLVFGFSANVEGNSFLLDLQRQLLLGEFRRRFGFDFAPLPFSLDDVPAIVADVRQLNAFLDLRAVHDPANLAPVFRDRIRSSFDRFAHFLHVRSLWEARLAKAATDSARFDRVDLKSDALRVFLSGVWVLGGREFRHSHEIYAEFVDPRVVAAYDFLLRIRAFAHSRRPGPAPSPGGNHPEDVLSFDDFLTLGDLCPDPAEIVRAEFATAVRARFLEARRLVAQFAQGIMAGELKSGRTVAPASNIVLGPGGLSLIADRSGQSEPDRSRAALHLLLAAQIYGGQIDPAELLTTFRDAGQFLRRVPELAALFSDSRGSLATSLAFLAHLPGALDSLFPGYAAFEASIDVRVRTERSRTRGAFMLQKLQALERFVVEGRDTLARVQQPAGVDVGVEAALLPGDALAAVRLALVTKRLPLTREDVARRDDGTRPRSAQCDSGFSGIPTDAYYAPFVREAGFSADSIGLVEFLVEARRSFKLRAETGLNDALHVAEFAGFCRDEVRLRSLFVFTCCDRAEWESPASDPGRWLLYRELFIKALACLRPPGTDPARALQAAGYSPQQLAVLRDLGADFFSGVYRYHANVFGAHLARLVEDPAATGPKVRLLRDGSATLLGIAAHDRPGLAASIMGTLFHRGIESSQVHLFTATTYAVALDFITLAPKADPLPEDLTRMLEFAIQQRQHTTEADAASLPAVEGRASLRAWRPAVCCLQFETTAAPGAVMYMLTYKIFRYLRGNIFALAAHAGNGRTYVSAYHSLPADLSFADAQHIVATRF